MARFLAMRVKMGYLSLEEIKEPLKREVGKILEEMVWVLQEGFYGIRINFSG